MKRRILFPALALAVFMCVTGALASAAYPTDVSGLPFPSLSSVATDADVSGGQVSVGILASVSSADGSVFCRVMDPSGILFLQTVSMVYADGTLSADMSRYPAGSYIHEVLTITIHIETTEYTLGCYYGSDGALSFGTISSVTDAQVTGIYTQYGLIQQFRDERGTAHYTDGALQSYELTLANGIERYDASGQMTYKGTWDPDTGDSESLYYENGELAARLVYVDTTDEEFCYDGEGRLRAWSAPLSSDTYAMEYYSENGKLLARVTRDTSGNTSAYDASGKLAYQVVDSVDGYYAEMYDNGQPVQRIEVNNGDTDQARMYYEDGVLTERWAVNTDGGYTIFDGEGTLIGTLQYDDFMRQSYKRYDAQGKLSEYSAMSTSGSNNLYAVYNGSGDLKSLVVYSSYYNMQYAYDAKTGRWYINNVPYGGPAPLDVYATGLKTSWYPNNTLCSFGPQFRDMVPGLTDKWYMFTPLDLSQDGTQSFELIASNMYVIGSVQVTVSGDSVTVTYTTTQGQYGHVYMKSEYLSFFPDLKSVTTVDPEELGGGFAFGQTISIQNDLGGDTNVLMFIRNVATYRNSVRDGVSLTRYYKTDTRHTALRDAMLALME